MKKTSVIGIASSVMYRVELASKQVGVQLGKILLNKLLNLLPEVLLLRLTAMALCR